MRSPVFVWLAALVTLAAGCKSESRRAPAPRLEPDEPAVPAARRGDGSSIEYTLGFAGAKNHYIDVAMTAPTGGAATIELMMAVWTPGSYLVREFSRHVETLEARGPGGAPLAVRKVKKNRWRVDTGGAASVAVHYRVYGREATVRTDFVDADLAMINGAPTFLTVAGDEKMPHDVLLELPEGWKKSVTALPPHPDGAANHYLATDYDQLVDSPIVAGNPELRDFEVSGADHVLATFLGAGRWDHDRSARDLATLVAEQHRFWRLVPYRRYVFFNVLLGGGGGGGLEHKASTMMMTDRFASDTDERYRRWLGLVSHEYFHTWNVKRLRPVALGPFDYENEVYTRGLWIAEGITSYYGDLLLCRAGLWTRDQYLAALSGAIASLQKTPGRRLEPLSRASFDAWIEYYRADENTRNSAVSYYTKGEVVAFLLDAEIRRRSGGAHSLDDLMRLAYRRFSGDRGFEIAGFRAAASEVAGSDLSSFFAAAVDGTGELDYAQALAYFGLRFKLPDADKADGASKAFLGLEANASDGRLVVSRVVRDSPAWRAGVDVGDELLAFGDERIPAAGLETALGRLEPGHATRLLVARRGRLRRLEVEPSAPPVEAWSLATLPGQSATQAAHVSRWLGPS